MSDTINENSKNVGEEVSASPETGPSSSENLATEASAPDLAAEWKSKFLYLSAEMENLRKRVVKEKSDVIKYANEDLIKSLLPILDNLQLALQSVSRLENQAEKAALESPVIKNLVAGFEMTLKHFEQTMERLGVQSFKALGEIFDPNFHEAIGQESQTDKEDNAVINELQRGFTLHGRVIRAARVIVNKIQSRNHEEN